jgi:ATP-dependent helicase/nuclease subunit B
VSTRHRGVRLIVGPPGAGPGRLEEAFVEEARRLQASDPLRPVVVLAGSSPLRLRLSRLLAVRTGGHANVRFLLMRDLAEELGAPALRDRGRRRLPELARELLLRSVVQAHAHGTCFERIALTEGFCEALGATVSDLKEAGVEPALVRAAGAGMRAAGKGQRAPEARRRTQAISGRKLEDLAALYEAYDDTLQDRRFYDEPDLMRSAATATSPGADKSGQSPAVLVYGFYDLNWQQRTLLQSYLAFRQAAVFFPFEADDPDNSFDFARPMLDWLGGWVAETGTLPPRGASAPVPPEVSLLSAPGEGREVVEAVRWLIGMARDRSLPFGTMALLYRSAEPYRQSIAEVMAEAGGVPHHLSDGLPLSRLAAARALLLLLEARRDGLSRRTVMDLLTLTDTTGQAALWDRISREAGVVRGPADWKRRLDRVIALAHRPSREGHDGATTRAAGSLWARVEQLHAALQAIPGQGSWSDLVAAAIDALRRFVPAELEPAGIERRLEPLGGLDDIVTPVTLDEFIARARGLLDRAVGRSGEFERSGIFVGGVMEARLLSFDAVAMVGLVERGFPSPPREDPILLDDERDEINRLVGEPRLPLKKRRLEEERLLFRLATSSATETLRLSWPRLDPATARPRNPSPFLLRLAAQIAGRAVDYDALEQVQGFETVSLAALGPARPGASVFGREFDLAVLRREMDQGNEPAMRRRVASFLNSNPMLARALEAEQARWGESRFTAHDGVLLRPHVVDHLRGLHPLRDRALSATRIERYAACPLKYFLRDVLGLQAVEEPEEALQIDPLQRGRLLHAILYDLFSALRDRGALPLATERLPEAFALLADLARQAFAREEEEGVSGPRMVWEIEKERILEDLQAVLASEAAEQGSFQPAHFELRYGMPRFEGEPDDPASSEDPIPFELRPGQQVLLKGRIDRVDVSRDGRWVRVTDYKSGRLSGYAGDSLGGGTTVQLPLYMLAAERLLGQRHPGIRAHSGRYLSVDRTGGHKQVTFSAEALAARQGELRQAVSTFLQGAERGVFFAYPQERVCEFCDYQLACGEGREARFERKKGDATAADFRRMKELP